MQGGFLRGFERDFEGRSGHPGDGLKHARVATVDDAGSGIEPIDHRPVIARQVSAGLEESGLQQVFGQHAALHKSVESLAGIVAMQSDDTVEGLHPNLGLQEPNLGMGSLLPELAVQIHAGAGMTGAVFVARGIAQWVDEQRVALGDFGPLFQGLQELAQSQHSLRFIAVQRGENADSLQIATPLPPDIQVARDGVVLAADLDLSMGGSDQPTGVPGYALEGLKNLGDGASASLDRRRWHALGRR